MIPVFDYLYYKLYQASLKSSLRDIPEFMAPLYLGGLLSVNILVISAFMTNLNLAPFLFSNKEHAIILTLILIVFALIYFRKNRRELILIKYSKEKKKERIRGNIIVSIYVALSFLLIFAVAFLKPEKL
jgi:uncharacterized protein YacL